MSAYFDLSTVLALTFRSPSPPLYHQLTGFFLISIRRVPTPRYINTSRPYTPLIVVVVTQLLVISRDLDRALTWASAVVIADDRYLYEPELYFFIKNALYAHSHNIIHYNIRWTETIKSTAVDTD